jgi:hypothetical protein
MTLPNTPTDFLAQLLAGGALYGLVVTWLLDGLLTLWERHTGAPVSGTKRRWLSIAVALLVPVAAYGGLCALGAAVVSADGLYSAVLVGVAATAGKQVVYAGRESLAKPTGVPLGEDPAYRAAHDASGDPDRPNGGHMAPQTARLPAIGHGGHPKRAPSLPPSPRGAPAAAEGGAPSLADTLAADMGLDPRDITPEDRV